LFACLLFKENEAEHDAEAAVASDDENEPEPSMIQGTDALMTVVDMPENTLAAVEAETGENDD